MGRIARYQQDKLASSVVGTPGVDTSGQQIGESAAQSFGRVSNTLFQVAQNRQAIVNEAEASSAFAEYETAHLQNTEALKTQYATNPRKALQEMQNNATSLAAEFSGSLSNPSVRNRFQQLVTDRVQKSNRELNNWSLTQDSINAVNNYKNGFSSFSIQGANAPDLLSLENVINDIEDQSQRIGNTILGSKNPEFTQDTINETLESFLLNQAMSDPLAAEEMLQDKLFNRLGNKSDTLKKIRSLGKSNQERKKLDLQIKQEENESNTEKDILFNSSMNINQKISALRLAETKKEISTEFANAAESYLNSESSIDGVTDQEQLYQEFRKNLNFSFVNFSQKKNQKNALGLMNDLRQRKVEILNAAKEGNITAKHARQLMSMLSNKQNIGYISDAINQFSKGDWTSFTNVYEDMDDAINAFDEAFSNSPQDKYQASVMFFDRMMNQLESEGRAVGAFTSDEISRLAGEIKDQVSNQRRNRVLTAIEGNVSTTKSDEDLKNWWA